jgi:hypothetical protein
MNINFAVIITLPGDYGADADFGLVVEGGLSKFKWSVGTATGYATGFLVDEWCSEMTNSVDPEGGGGVAQIGGFTITAANGTQLYKLLDTLPIQKALIEVRELPFLAVAKGRIDYYNWDDRRVDFFVESLDASADVSLSGIVDDKVIPMQLGSLRYAEGVRTTSKADVLAVPGLSHTGEVFPIAEARAERLIVRADTSPTDWAGAVSYLQGLVPGLVCSFNGALRRVVDVEDLGLSGGFYRLAIYPETSFFISLFGADQFAGLPVSFLDYSQRYDFDTWDLSFGGKVWIAQNGENVLIENDSFEFDERGCEVIPAAALPDNKFLVTSYRRSFADVLVNTTVTPVNGLAGGAWTFVKLGNLSNEDITDDYQYTYSGIINSTYGAGITVAETDAKLRAVELIKIGFTFNIPAGTVVRFAISDFSRSYIVTNNATGTNSTTIQLSDPLDKAIGSGEVIQFGAHIKCRIWTKDVFSTQKGRPYIAMDVEEEPIVADIPLFDVHIRGFSWDGSSIGLCDFVPQRGDLNDVVKVANLAERLGGQNSPYFYPNEDDKTNQNWQNGNGWKQSELDLADWDELKQYNGIDVYLIKYPGNLQRDTKFYIREMGFGLASETALPDRIYCEAEGRGVGLGAKTGWTAAMQTPNQFAQHIRQLTNNGGTPPDAGWGQNYGFGNTLAYRVIRAGAGGFNDSDILQFGFSTNAAAASIPDAGALDAMRSLFRENFVINWIDANGLPAVAQLVRAYSRMIVKRITLKEIIPGTISVDEMQASEIYCNPVIKWGELPNGEYEGTLSITGSELALATEAEQAARVQGSSLDQAGRALLWQRARALYLKYGNVAPMPEELSVLQWCKSATVADWHLQNLLSWYGVNNSAVVSPRRFFRFTVPYEVALDDLVFRFDVGSRFILNLPHQTDGDDYECICLNVSHDLVGLQTTLYAVGFKSADWPTPVVPPDFTQDVFTSSDIWEDQFTDTDIKEDSWP